MRALLLKLAEKLCRLPRWGIFGLGLGYIVTLGGIDYAMPTTMRFTLLYLLGIAFVAWGGGLRAATALSFVTAMVITADHLIEGKAEGEFLWASAWNVASGLGVFLGTGWLTAQVTRFSRELGQRVEEHTAEWQAEAAQHKTTASRLAEALQLLQAQRDVGIHLSVTRDLKAALNPLLEVLLTLQGIDCGGVYLVDPQTGSLELAAFRGDCSAEFIAYVSHYSADSPAARLVRQQRPVYGAYREVPALQDPVREKEGLRAVAILPLCHEGKVVGSLHLGSHTHDSIPARSQMVIEAIGAQTAGAIARIRAEEALQQSEARLRTIINTAPLALFATDHLGVITFEDGRDLKSLAALPGARVGRHVAEVFADYPLLADNVRRALAGEEFRTVYQLKHQWVDCVYCPTTDQHGVITGCIGVATNITERQRLERQVLEISDHEQARLGQEIHDGLCQQLVSLAFDANTLEGQLSEARRPEAALARRIADFLDQAITETRRLARGLFPIRLSVEGLSPALGELARATRERFAVDCRFEGVEPRIAPSKTAATHLYRIAQEAVTNAVKHSQATSIAIRLSVRDGLLELEVADNGRGLAERGGGRVTGMGLSIMEYRARSLGGTLRLSEAPGGGTSVSCCVPGFGG